MLSGIIRARGSTFCCSLGTRIFIARGRFSAAKDWVGSCGTIIKRRHKRWDVPQMNFLTMRGLNCRASIRSATAATENSCSYSLFAGAPGSTAATPSGLMLKAKNVNGSLPGFPHWCTRPNGS